MLSLPHWMLAPWKDHISLGAAEGSAREALKRWRSTSSASNFNSLLPELRTETDTSATLGYSSYTSTTSVSSRSAAEFLPVSSMRFPFVPSRPRAADIWGCATSKFVGGKSLPSVVIWTPESLAASSSESFRPAVRRLAATYPFGAMANSAVGVSISTAFAVALTCTCDSGALAGGAFTVASFPQPLANRRTPAVASNTLVERRIDRDCSRWTKSAGIMVPPDYKKK